MSVLLFNLPLSYRHGDRALQKQAVMAVGTPRSLSFLIQTRFNDKWNLIFCWIQGVRDYLNSLLLLSSAMCI